jgi:hypothetical protein
MKQTSPGHQFVAAPPELVWSHVKIVLRWHSASLLIGLIVRAVINHILWRLGRISKPLPSSLVEADSPRAEPRPGKHKGEVLIGTTEVVPFPKPLRESSFPAVCDVVPFPNPSFLEELSPLGTDKGKALVGTTEVVPFPKPLRELIFPAACEVVPSRKTHETDKSCSPT